MNPTSLHTLDWAVRAGVIGVLLLVATLLLRDRVSYLRARITAALAVGTAAYVLHFGPGFAVPIAWWQVPILAISAGNMVMFWIFASALFDDEFRLRGVHGVAWAGIAGIAVATCLLGGSYPAAARALGASLDAAGIVFALLAISRAVVSWRDDLVEGRRRLRLFIVSGGAVYALLVTASRFGMRPGTAAEASSLLDIVGLAVIVVVAAWCLLQIAPQSELARVAAPAPDAPAATSVKPVVDMAPDPAEEALIARLQSEMGVERAYRRENLTIGALATQLGLQEYRLRRLINQRLGYRNFNAFLNHYRLVEAMRVLGDPARADVPVLTVAIDVGFQSIGPFNRAFKAATGLTPTEYRRAGRPVPADASRTLADSEIG